MIRFRCPCGKKLKAPPEKAGASLACPHCLAPLTVPDPPAEEDPIPPRELEVAEVDEDERRERRIPVGRPRRDRSDDGEEEADELDDGRPLRRRRGKDLGPVVVKGALLGALVGGLAAIPVAVLCSQFFPLSDGVVALASKPFSEGRAAGVPFHLFALGRTGVLFGGALGAAVAYLRAVERR